MQCEHTEDAFINLFVHFCIDRNEPKNDFWEGTYPFPKNPHPSPAKPPDHNGRFCSRREENAAKTEPLVLRTEILIVQTHRKKYLFFIFSKVFEGVQIDAEHRLAVSLTQNCRFHSPNIVIFNF